MDLYKLEMVLLFYSVVIGFSFKMFEKFRILSFQSFCGIAAILFLTGRLLSIKSKFSDAVPYNEFFFLMDIAIIICFYRFLAILEHTSSDESDVLGENASSLWIWFAVMMLFTLVYRVLYAGISISSLSQISIVVYGIGGYLLCRTMRAYQVAMKRARNVLLLYSLPLLLASIGYCIFRFRYQF